MKSPAQLQALARARAARSAAAAERRLEVPSNCRLIEAGIDTLHLYTRAPLRPEVVKELLELKTEAIEKRLEQQAALPRWRANGLEVEVQPHGVRKADLMARSPVGGVVLFVNSAGAANLPTAYVELGAQFLWAGGWQKAAAWAEGALEQVAQPDAKLDVQVSRLDLACDFYGWQVGPELAEHLYGRVVRRDKVYENPDESWLKEHGRGRHFTGFTFGGGALMMRLYNKSHLATKQNALWWLDMWRARSDWRSIEEDGHVWRLEPQIRREPLTHATVLRNGVEHQVGGWEATKLALNELWSYLLRRWLSYRLPRTGKERVRLHPRWVELLSARFVDTPDGELYRHQLAHNLNATTGQFAGFLKRGLAEQWHADGSAPYKARLADDVERLIARADRHYKLKHEEEDLFVAAERLWRQQEALRRLFGGKLATS